MSICAPNYIRIFKKKASVQKSLEHGASLNGVESVAAKTDTTLSYIVQNDASLSATSPAVLIGNSSAFILEMCS